jgi:CHAT domain-containing protein
VDFLFAGEIYDLDLAGVGLVTLAACDTEAGRTISGEGVAALSRAFLSAGAHTTISTLWRVGDQSSAELMRRFYGRMARGEPAAEALRAAKRDFLRSNAAVAHPRYWAAFVLNGEPGTSLPRPVPLTAGMLAGTAGLCAIAALWMLAARLRRRRSGPAT